MADILVAEDYPATRSVLRTLLRGAGHTVRFAVNGEEALAQVAQKRPDLLLLDVMMPKKSGYEVLGEIRRTDAALPVILLTAKGEKSDVVLGLGLGSDDYVKKPFDGDELLARVSAALRRAGQAATSASVAQTSTTADIPEGSDFTFASFRVDANRLKLIDARGHVKDLFINEYKILSYLARHPGEVVSRDELLKVLWEGEDYFGTTHSIDQAIYRLRAKLGPDGSRVETVYRVGYRYVPPK
jgi:DNA-binding response OmpR family regulator